MSDIMGDELADMTAIVDQVKDEARRKELRSHDENEDYLDEGLHCLSWLTSCARKCFDSVSVKTCSLKNFIDYNLFNKQEFTANVNKF